MESPAIVPEPVDEDDQLLNSIEIDVIIDGLVVAMKYQNEEEKVKTQVIINGLEAAKSYI